MVVLLTAGCAVIPAPRPSLTSGVATPTTQPQQTTFAVSPTPGTTQQSTPRATADPGGCTISFVLDEVGHGGTFSGEGFAPGSPLTMTVTSDNAPPQVLDEEDFPQLEADVRGAW